MQIEPLYTWQIEDFNRLSRQKNDLPNAILLHGGEYCGVLSLATNVIAALLCEDTTLTNGVACKKCNSCNLILDDSHPDLLNLSKEALELESKYITVDLARKAIDFAYLTPNFSKYRIILIENMAMLNINSANSLLKILEEPPPYVIFFMITNNITGILPTILSRCQKFIVKPIQSSNAAKEETFWSRYNRNQPLAIEGMTNEELSILINVLITPSVDNIFSCSEIFNGKNIAFGDTIEFIYKWLTDITIYINTGELLIFKTYEEQIKKLTVRINKEQIFYLFDEVNFLFKWLHHPLNYKLQLENILFKYQQLFSIES